MLSNLGEKYVILSTLCKGVGVGVHAYINILFQTENSPSSSFLLSIGRVYFPHYWMGNDTQSYMHM